MAVVQEDADLELVLVVLLDVLVVLPDVLVVTDALVVPEDLLVLVVIDVVAVLVLMILVVDLIVLTEDQLAQSVAHQSVHPKAVPTALILLEMPRWNKVINQSKI
jgi:hypothetical protein